MMMLFGARLVNLSAFTGFFFQDYHARYINVGAGNESMSMGAIQPA